MEARTVQFILERETKGALRYAEIPVGNEPAQHADNMFIGTLYIRKAQMRGTTQWPSTLTVTVEW